MKRKPIFKVIIGCCLLLAVGVIALAVHIYIVTHANTAVKNNRQLSRIDFKQPLDSAQAGNIRNFVAHLPGVESTFFNIKDGILVYTYAPGEQTSLNVYNAVVAHGNYKAERYVVDNAALKSSCPVINNKQSVSSVIVDYFSNF